MFVTRILSAALVGGSLAVGAVVAAQQPTGGLPEALPRRPSARPAAPEVDPAAVAKEMAQLEVGLLDEEVKQVRAKVTDALKARVDYETSTAAVDPRAWQDAEATYQKAREVYLKKSRELAIARRRYGLPEEKAESKGSGDAGKGADAGKERKAADPSPAVAGAGAVIGSIDMAAVLKGFEKARQYDRQLAAHRDEARARIARLQSEARSIADQMAKLAPGGEGYRTQNDRAEEVKRRIRRETEGYQEEHGRRQARVSASLLEDIQEVIAAIARDRGLDYVIKVAPAPSAEASYDDVVAALNRSVLYANPRHDITDEVIRALNRRFAPAGDRAGD